MENQQQKLLGDNKYNPIEERIFLRPISKNIAFLLNKKTSLTPDQISFFGFFLTIATIYTITNQPTNVAIITLLLFISIIFDKIDGDLARLKQIAGPKGQYVDGFLDVTGEVLLLSAWALVFSNSIPDFLVLISIASTAIFNYHGVAAPLYLGTTPNTHKAKTELSFFNKLAISLGYGRAKLFFAMIITLLLGIPEVLFWFLPLLIVYTTILYYRNIFIKNLTKR